ncbi:MULTISPECIES: [NiFe]-hydrogenase assembly chaperone HybE [Halomonadaceae]|uniref:[NiFe]-hydrogenase assembly chaperone HybE n=1 Tax=Halomonadaceae TaxID=28256 RepID=UPI001B8BFE46|nr:MULTISPECIES: [NiFe]-hydrogenase assembly chaperone HybE [Halomonas]MBS3667895.1 [NiFe]-hydrogenase assembly chaperone HybE [Halomonas boliviensis]MCA8865187.1 [NiFe]-hydrogenase assembly chaperone HybE [Halomonas sp. SBBP1]UZH12160.1 [NiFe]-hydrogenase assembly chaperone HybE [Halomonas sp. BDJS001]
MQTLTADEYALLAEVAKAYRDAHLPSMKQKSDWNPRLGVDALCFQHYGAEHLVGALITPCELWLVAVPQPALRAESMAETLTLSLPSGAYRLSRELLPGGYQLYKRAILGDLSALESMQEAARLAQQMMARLMQPAEVSNA